MTIPGWPHHIVKIVELVQQYQPMNGVEIGTYCGASAIPVALAMQAWGGRLTCIDPWADRHRLLECVRYLEEASLASWVSLIVAHSAVVAAHWQSPIDYLYIDGDHSFDAVYTDLFAWWPHLTSGALVCGDDWDDPLSPGVRQAWERFSDLHDWPIQTFATENTNPPGMKLVWGIKP